MEHKITRHIALESRSWLVTGTKEWWAETC